MYTFAATSTIDLYVDGAEVLSVTAVDSSPAYDRVAALPGSETTRISVGLWRTQRSAGEEHGDYACIVELGGFLVSGPCAATEITNRFGRGSYRVTAYGFDPPGLRWEVLVSDLHA